MLLILELSRLCLVCVFVLLTGCTESDSISRPNWLKGNWIGDHPLYPIGENGYTLEVTDEDIKDGYIDDDQESIFMNSYTTEENTIIIEEDGFSTEAYQITQTADAYGETLIDIRRYKLNSEDSNKIEQCWKSVFIEEAKCGVLTRADN